VEDPVTVGVVFGSITPPEQIARVARLAEDLGFDELWFSEDCFFSGGMAGMAQILASTRRIPVGAGAVSIASRHPAITAMEFAGLARMYPGRVRAGVALGVRAWLDQMGVRPAKPLTALRETVGVLRDLFAGKEATAGRIRLDYPPPEPLPIHVAAVNEKALRAAGTIADGTILSVLSSPDYVRWARSLVGPRQRLTAFALYAVDHDGARARAAVRDAAAMFLSAEADSALVRVPGIDGHAERPVPDRVLDQVTVAGTPAEVTARLRALYAAGADAVGLWLFPTADAERVARLTAREVLPHLRQAAADQVAA
jgi:5,10-methylenetetrahydromethanopterin reductase